jgi:hypothetical protein
MSVGAIVSAIFSAIIQSPPCFLISLPILTIGIIGSYSLKRILTTQNGFKPDHDQVQNFLHLGGLKVLLTGLEIPKKSISNLASCENGYLMTPQLQQKIEECEKLRKHIDIMKEWTKQIRDFVSQDQELEECFYDTFIKEGHHVVSSNVPILEIDEEDPEGIAYALDRYLDKSIRQFRELIHFIVVNDELWNCFIANVKKRENTAMLNLFDRIFTLLRTNIEKEFYEQLRILLAKEVEELTSKKHYKSKFIREVLFKLTSTSFEFQFFTAEMLNSVSSSTST